MDSRFFLTIILCFLIATVYLTVVQKLRPEPQSAPVSSQDAPGSQGAGNQAHQGAGNQGAGSSNGSGNGNRSASGNSSASGNQAEVSNGGSESGAPAVVTPALPQPDRRKIQLMNELVELELDNRGASVTQVLLPNYREDELDQPLALWSTDLQSGPAFTLWVDQSLPFDLTNRNWEIVSEDLSARAVTYRMDLGDGREILKSYRLAESEYLLEVDVEFRGEWVDGRYEILGPQRIRRDATSLDPNRQVIAFGGVDWRLADVERESIGLVPKGEKTWAASQRVLWSGLESNFFAYAMRPLRDDVGESRLVVRGDTSDQADEAAGELRERGLQGYAFQVGFLDRTAADKKDRYEVYLGPKDRAVLEAYEEQGYGELVYYGKWLGALVRIFLALLSFFHGIFGSFGIGIVCLTVIVKLVLHPINRKNQAVMMRQQKKMAKIQPQMKEIRERHKNDALKANREIQKLMKEQNVNPAQMFGGCLLMFLQLPIWIGLITTFRLAIELRHTPFLYVSDLTQPDRLFELPFSIPFLGEWFNLLPVLYVITTIIAQKMAPKATDPQMAQQQKLMMYMMVAFGFIFYSFSSGLLLYFLTSAALGIVEQRIIRAELAKEDEK